MHEIERFKKNVGEFKRSVENTLATLVVICVVALLIYWRFGDVLALMAGQIWLIILGLVPYVVGLVVLVVLLFVALKYGSAVRPKFVRSRRERTRTAREVEKQSRGIR